MIKSGLGLVLVAEAAGQPVAAAVVVAWNGTMIGKFIASDEEAWQLRPNNLLVWHAVQAASELGCGMARCRHSSGPSAVQCWARCHAPPGGRAAVGKVNRLLLAGLARRCGPASSAGGHVDRCVIANHFPFLPFPSVSDGCRSPL